MLADLGLYSNVRLVQAGAASLYELQAADRRQALVGDVQLVIFAIAAFFFIRWFHRAYPRIAADSA